MAHLIKLTLFAAPFTAHAYNVRDISRVEVIPSVPAGPGVPPVQAVPAIPEHARVVFSGIGGGNIEVKETQASIMAMANA